MAHRREPIFRLSGPRRTVQTPALLVLVLARRLASILSLHITSWMESRRRSRCGATTVLQTICRVFSWALLWPLWLSQLRALAQVHDAFTIAGPTLPRISDRSIAELANESPSTRTIRKVASHYWSCSLANMIFEMPCRSDLSLSSSHRIGVGDLVAWWDPDIR